MSPTDPALRTLQGPGASARPAAAAAPRRAGVVLPFALLALTALLWSGNWIVGRDLRDAMPPVALTFWRWVGAALILAPFVLPRLAGRWHRVLRHWRVFLLLGATGAALFQLLVYVGLSMTATINAVLMNSSMPLFILLCSWLIERETASLRQIAGVAVSLLGILVIMMRGDAEQLLHLQMNLGDAVILAAMPAWGVYSVVLKRRPSEFTGVEFLFVLALAGIVCLAPLFIAENALYRSGTLTPRTFGGVVYVALAASVLGYICWNKGVEAVGANRAGFTIHLLPAFGTVLAILLLGEEFHLYHLVGIATILGGVFLATSAPRNRD